VQIVGLIEDIVHTPNTVIDAPLGGIASSDASRPSAKLPLGLICAAEDAAQNRSQSKGPCCPAAYDCRLNFLILSSVAEFAKTRSEEVRAEILRHALYSFRFADGRAHLTKLRHTETSEAMSRESDCSTGLA